MKKDFRSFYEMMTPKYIKEKYPQTPLGLIPLCGGNEPVDENQIEEFSQTNEDLTITDKKKPLINEEF